MSCFYALQGQMDTSLYWLEQAITLCPPLRIDARTDDHFDTIRTNPRFIELVYTEAEG